MHGSFNFVPLMKTYPFRSDQVSPGSTETTDTRSGWVAISFPAQGEGVSTTPAPLVARRGSAKSGRLEARSRHELLLCIRTVVRDLAPWWGDEDSATVVIVSPWLGPGDVLMAFDEINERYHVLGMELEFDEQEGEPLRAVFTRTA